KQRAAALKQSQAEQAQNDAYAAVYKEQGERAAKQQAIDDPQYAANQAEYQKHSQLMGQAVQRAADYKIDPNRRFRNAGTGGQILAMIGIMLSGIGMGFAGKAGEDPAFDYMNQLIDKDVDEQWKEKQALGETANQEKGIVDQLHQAGGDIRSGMELHRAALN